MKWLLALLLAGSAQAATVQNYVLQCASPCAAPDGTTQPAGTILPGMITRWDGVTPWAPPSGFVAVPYTGQPVYAPSVAPAVPASVEAWKLQIVLLNTPSKIGSGKTAKEDADALAVQQGGAVLLAWQNAPIIQRSSPSINALAGAIGFTQADIDAAFIATQSVNY